LWGHAREHGLGLFEYLMTKLFPYFDITRDDEPGVIYLRRFFIYPRDKDFGKNKEKGRIYLHKFYRGDEDKHLHTHPWSFTSFILTRGYWEETPFDFSKDVMPRMSPWYTGHDPYLVHRNGEYRIRKFYRRFKLLRRPATWAHRVIIKDKKPVWTIVRTGVKERSWGFIIDGVQCYWKKYKNGLCWCGDEVEK
jgi:hypothetical protein